MSDHNIVEEFNDPIIVGNSNWNTKQFEIRLLRNVGSELRPINW
jgi:hypothetical protein